MLQHGRRRSDDLQSIEVERRRKESYFVDVHKVTTRQVPGVIPSALDDLASPRRQRLYDDVRLVKPYRRGMACIENPFAVRQQLWVALRCFAISKRGDRLGC